MYAHRYTPALTGLLAGLPTLRADMLALAEQAAEHPNFEPSARNQLHYLAQRQHDRRDLQRRVAALSLSLLGRAAPNAGAGSATEPVVVGCTILEVLDSVQPGKQIWFDDGKIGGVAEQVDAQTVHVRTTQARAEGDKLRNHKGINLPNSQLAIPALTDKDLQDLVFIAQHADVVKLSFVNSPADILLLREHLRRLTGRVLPIVLKVEIRRGFEQLPALLLCTMQAESCGVMIARGDLAVECGFRRLAQEEVLCLCEAAHVPVSWATKVLKGLASGGCLHGPKSPMPLWVAGLGALCAAKGSHVAETLQSLGGVLRRMEAHQSKESALLRSLQVAGLFSPE